MRVRMAWMNAVDEKYKCGECEKTSKELGDVMLMLVKFRQSEQELMICGECLHDLAGQASKKQYELLPKTGMHYN